MTKKMTKALESITQRVLGDPEISVITKRMLALSKRRSSTQHALLEEFYREVYKKTNSRITADHATSFFKTILLRGGRRKPMPVFGIPTQGGAVNPR